MGSLKVGSLKLARRKLSPVTLRLLVGIGVVLAIASAPLSKVVGENYEVIVAMPSASGIFDGAHVMMNGEQVGEVTNIRLEHNTAMVTIAIDDDHSPLPSDTRARISWQSVLGTRALELVPGTPDSPTLSSGDMLVANTERVEVDDLLAALDEPTRRHLRGFLTGLDATFSGAEGSAQETLKSAGPTAQALGEILRAVGQDGPAIRQLVSRLSTLTERLVSRKDEIATVIDTAGSASAGLVEEQEALTDTLAALPRTLREATETLEAVPAAVRATNPLLDRLQPATAVLPEVARQLEPLLRDLRPAVSDLRPALRSASVLLSLTPGLLDGSHAVLPGTAATVEGLKPAADFLRPYTPELVGWLSNWTSLFGGQNGQGNFGRALILEGASSFNGNAGTLPPGIDRSNEPGPGEVGGQPWTDAYGDGMN